VQDFGAGSNRSELREKSQHLAKKVGSSVLVFLSETSLRSGASWFGFHISLSST
jgi:hypothetical protein